jgi:ribose 5-phosphate isomerase B
VPHIIVNDLTMAYGRVVIQRDLTFTVNRGDVFIIMGGSGNEAIVANRLRGIRCAVVWNTRTAALAREHGDCNMIAIGQRMMSKAQAVAIVDAWLGAEFKGGRHQQRIDKIDE